MAFPDAAANCLEPTMVVDNKDKAALADEVRRTLADIDEIEGQLRKAETAIGKAQAHAAKHRASLAGLCAGDVAGRKMPDKRRGSNGSAGAGKGSGSPEN